MPMREQGPYVLEAVAPSAGRTASGDTGVLDGYGPVSTLRLQLNVTTFTVAAGNTLDVVVEDTLDGINYNAIGTFAQKTAAGREVMNITIPFSDRLRVRWTIGGSPAPTFSVAMFSQWANF